jgi:hypothetical protein
MFKSSLGYQRMANYISKHKEVTNNDSAMCCQIIHVIDENTKVSHDNENDPYQWKYPPMAFKGELTPKRSNVTIKTPVDRNELVTIEFGDENIKELPIADSSKMDPTSEMLFLHYKLGHISFKKIKQMAHDGTLPKKF